MMKTITKHLLLRFTWFMLWFKQWFKNTEGIKGFAVQVMNWLMQSTMALAEKLKNQNKKLTEAIKTTKAKLAKWNEHPTVDADEWDEVKGTVRKLGFWITIGIIAEAALNYFGVSAVITPKGWGWTALNAVIALVLTGFGVYIFKQWFAVALNKPMYKQEESKRRNLLELGVLTLLCVAFEAVIYYLCKIRGIALEGGNGDDFVTWFVTLAGMLLPLVAGYLANERSLYTSPYYNTIRLAKAEKTVARMESKIATNNQKMEDHFKRKVQEYWALLQEFKVYKENYNQKNAIEQENITGHFCETHDRFEKEAVQRYQKEILHQTPVQPTLIITKEQMNGHAKQLNDHFNH
ncbi:MAG: hypothetical protein QM725_12090 [Lacibacter sp.]